MEQDLKRVIEDFNGLLHKYGKCERYIKVDSDQIRIKAYFNGNIKVTNSEKGFVIEQMNGKELVRIYAQSYSHEIGTAYRLCITFNFSNSVTVQLIGIY